MCAGMSGHSASRSTRSLCLQSGCLTSLREVAPALCFISSYCARDDDLALSWSLRLSKVVDERLSSKRVPHLAPGRRSNRFVRNSIWRAGY
ncbi:hypothetical protein F2Q70_00023164 [Brassica cretica]|uniref:Uncharacterized protein n=1 Tax=Brassica cretica TaxID=69181 RepID=A0A8S9GMH2_BRACR|nr:hypothetical protein F2Q70_00023164 [Brassica cretica]